MARPVMPSAQIVSPAPFLPRTFNVQYGKMFRLWKKKSKAKSMSSTRTKAPKQLGTGGEITEVDALFFFFLLLNSPPFHFRALFVGFFVLPLLLLGQAAAN